MMVLKTTIRITTDNNDDGRAHISAMVIRPIRFGYFMTTTAKTMLMTKMMAMMMMMMICLQMAGSEELAGSQEEENRTGPT